MLGKCFNALGLVAPPVTPVMGGLANGDILELSKVFYSCWVWVWADGRGEEGLKKYSNEIAVELVSAHP